MPNVTELINEAIEEMASRPSIFSAGDVEAYADLDKAEDAIVIALRTACERQVILPLDEWQDGPRSSSCYLGMGAAERWWIDSTIRWAKSGVFRLNSLQLACAMSLAFDTRQWDAVPTSLLAVGRRWAMVADSYEPGVFVFPWAVVLYANPQCVQWFSQHIERVSSLLDSDALPVSSHHILHDAINNALGTITNREADVMRGRLGLETGQPATLEQLGHIYGVTRERIRQIEAKAWRKLWHPSRQRHLWSAFAAEFIRSSGSLLIPESLMTPWRKFLNQCTRLQIANIAELGLYFIVTDAVVSPYQNALCDVDTYLDDVIDPPYFQAMGALQFLSKHDGDRVAIAEKEYRDKQVVKTRYRMLREVLRSLGRAAHFTEIAELCNRMFPENQASIHNWHAALGRPESEARGIVWIGTKGTFGLKEHGYERPDTGLYDAIPKVVENEFAKTGRPVAEETVIIEMRKQRRELSIVSVKMVLSLSDKILPCGTGNYLPKSIDQNVLLESSHQQYDIDAAFAAFTSTVAR